MKLTALTPIRHDGKRYAEGETLEVDNKEQAAALVACGAAAEGGSRARSVKAPAKPNPEQLAAATAAVAAAQADLDAAPDDDAKAAAQQALDAAQADLQALKG